MLVMRPMMIQKSLQSGRQLSSAATELKSKLDVNNGYASTVIIGGGVIGTSIAYHLSKMGQKGVVLLEKSELTAGSTWHAAGLTTTYHPIVNMKKIHYNSLQLYSQIAAETGQEIGLHQPGSVRLATTPIMVDEFKYQMSRSGGQSAPQCLLNPNEIKALVPILDTDKILMGLYTPNDGHVDPYSLTQAIAKGAKMRGVTILQGTDVESLQLKSDGRWTVGTSKGQITTDKVVNAAGFWAKQVGSLAGIDLPLIAVEHQYLVTYSVPEIQALKREFPVLRHMEGSCYIRQEREGLLVGVFENQQTTKLREKWAVEGVPRDFGKELFDSDLDRMMPYLEKIMECIPSFSTATVQSIINGPITYAPGALPIVGPSEAHNLWLAVGFGLYGITHGGGIGQFLAEWMIRGEPSHDLIECDPGRFGKWTSHDYTAAKIRESYGMNYATTYPDEERFAGRPTMRVTPAYQKQIERGASMEFSHGWEHPGWFSESNTKPKYKPSFQRTNWHKAVDREWRSVKTNVGVIDLSPFGKFMLEGQKSFEFLDRVTANKVPSVNRSAVTHLLTPQAKVAAELTVTQLKKDQFFLVTGSGSEIHDLRWMENISRKENWNIKLTNVTDKFGCLSVAGPKSKEVLMKLDKRFSLKFPFFTHDTVSIAGIPVQALRLTYTGELGWELYCPIEATRQLYEAILTAGKNFDIQDFGTKTLNVLRLEKGFRMWGKEMSHNTNVIESGLMPFVSMTKTDFIGKDEIIRQQQRVQPTQLVMIKIDSASIHDPKGDESIWVGNKIIGNVTSGCYSHVLEQPLAFGYVTPFLSAPGTLAEVELMGHRYRAEVLCNPPDKTFNQKTSSLK